MSHFLNVKAEVEFCLRSCVEMTHRVNTVRLPTQRTLPSFFTADGTPTRRVVPLSPRQKVLRYGDGLAGNVNRSCDLFYSTNLGLVSHCSLHLSTLRRHLTQYHISHLGGLSSRECRISYLDT